MQFPSRHVKSAIPEHGDTTLAFRQNVRSFLLRCLKIWSIVLCSIKLQGYFSLWKSASFLFNACHFKRHMKFLILKHRNRFQWLSRGEWQMSISNKMLLLRPTPIPLSIESSEISSHIRNGYNTTLFPLFPHFEQLSSFLYSFNFLYFRLCRLFSLLNWINPRSTHLQS